MSAAASASTRAPAGAARAVVVTRAAAAADAPALDALIAASARALGRGFYTVAQTEAAIAHVFGVDSELIADGSYLVACGSDGGLLGCGGWSFRPTLFGGDRYAARASGRLDPAVDAARIRAFFVAPHAARQGVGAALLAACEAAARRAGFTRATLMATLPGVPFYARHGYAAAARRTFDLGGVAVDFVPMAKALAP